MAVEILRRGQSANQPHQSQNEAGLLTRGAFALGRGLEAPGHLFNAVAGLIGEPQSFEPQSEVLREKLGYTPQQLQPKNLLESIVQGGLEKIPTTAALGGGAVQAGLGFLGSAAKEKAKQAGFGPLAQAGIEFGTEVLGSAGARGLRPGKIRNDLRSEMKQGYALADKKIAKIPTQDATQLKESLTTIIDDLPTSGLNSAERNIVRKELINLEKNILHDKILPSNVLKYKRHVNNLIKNEFKKSDPNSALINQYRRTVGALNENLASTGKRFKSFGAPYQRSEDIFKGLDTPSAITRLLENNTSLKTIIGKDPTGQTVRALVTLASGYTLGIPTTSAAIASAFPLRYGARAYELFTKSKTARNLASKLAYEVGNDSIKSAVNTSRRLVHEIKKDKKNKPKIEIVRRGNANPLNPRAT